jgi:hypothetical protein
VTGNILNSKGLRIGVESGASIFDLSGKRVYDLKGVNTIVSPASWSAI